MKSIYDRYTELFFIAQCGLDLLGPFLVFQWSRNISPTNSFPDSWHISYFRRPNILIPDLTSKSAEMISFAGMSRLDSLSAMRSIKV